MDLNLFEDRNIANKNNENNENNNVNKFIDELTKALKNMMNISENRKNQNKELDEYNIYEKKKIFLDNKTRNGNDLVWIMDNNSVCISENGDGGPISADELELPQNKKIGEVYEKVDGKYVYNEDITIELNKIIK